MAKLNNLQIPAFAGMTNKRAFRDIWKSPNTHNTPHLPNSAVSAANMLLTFCQMETFLVHKQTQSLEDKFVREDGFRENLFKKRIKYKKMRG